jgi:aryl-alcohol dehydrogenase-like predicted oxidoreductase
MLTRNFGNTNIRVPVMGLGAGQIGDLAVADSDVQFLLNTAVDLGINLVDTARGYYASEDRIGRFLSHRRNDVVLSTKVGYGIEGYRDWTYDCIIAGVEEALKKLRTDFIDIVHLHSCPLETLQQGEVIAALDKARQEGKLLAAAYSGENEALRFAVESGRFQSIMTSVNITDQHGIDTSIAAAKKNGMGVIAKRPGANAFWRFDSQPYGDYSEQYWLRWQKMNIRFDIDPKELFLRFTAFTPGVDCCITGTRNTEHLKTNLEIINKGPLAYEVYSAIRKAFVENDDGWRGLTGAFIFSNTIH